MRKRRRLSSQNAFSPPTHSCIRRMERAFVSIPSPFFSSLRIGCPTTGVYGTFSTEFDFSGSFSSGGNFGNIAFMISGVRLAPSAKVQDLP
jgi:hypothetical protein